MNAWARVGIAVVGVVAVVLGTVLVAGGIGVRRDYHAAWEADHHEQFGDPRLEVASVALLAPSGHNMQPWRLVPDRADPSVMELFVDTRRFSPVVDPLGRQVMVSQGAFLEYMSVAGRELGIDVDIALFPDGEPTWDATLASLGARPVARLTLTRLADGPAEGGGTRNHSDYEAMFHPDTNRGPYAAQAVTPAQAAELRDVARASGTVPGHAAPTVDLWDSPADLAAIGDLARRGTDVEAGHAAAAAETAAVMRSNEREKNATRYGFSVEGQGTRGISVYLTQGLLTLVPGLLEGDSAATRARDLTRLEVENTPAWFTVTTSANTRTDQVLAGRAYAALTLRAWSLGLAVQPLSQAIQEYPAMAGEYAAAHRLLAPSGGTVQMLLRVGTPTRTYPVSIRQDVGSLVEGVEP